MKTSLRRLEQLSSRCAEAARHRLGQDLDALVPSWRAGPPGFEGLLRARILGSSIPHVVHSVEDGRAWERFVDVVANHALILARKAGEIADETWERPDAPRETAREALRALRVDDRDAVRDLYRAALRLAAPVPDSRALEARAGGMADTLCVRWRRNVAAALGR